MGLISVLEIFAFVQFLGLFGTSGATQKIISAQISESAPFIPPATLANISVSNGGKLVPEFNETHFTYYVRLGPNVRHFTVTVYFPASEEAENYYSAAIDSVPLKSGIPSRWLQLGKRGEIVTFNIFVMAVNHRPSAYQLMASRDTHVWRGFIEKILTIVGLLAAVIISGYLCYTAYSYYFTTRIPDSAARSIRGSMYRPIPSENRV